VRRSLANSTRWPDWGVRAREREREEQSQEWADVSRPPLPNVRIFLADPRRFRARGLGGDRGNSERTATMRWKESERASPRKNLSPQRHRRRPSAVSDEESFAMVKRGLVPRGRIARRRFRRNQTLSPLFGWPRDTRCRRSGRHRATGRMGPLPREAVDAELARREAGMTPVYSFNFAAVEQSLPQSAGPVRLDRVAREIAPTTGCPPPP